MNHFISFTAAGCGNARFASLGVFVEFRGEVRAQQAAILARRAAVARGVPRDDADFEMQLTLTEFGMHASTIEEHLADINLDVGGLIIQSRDL